MSDNDPQIPSSSHYAKKAAKVTGGTIMFIGAVVGIITLFGLFLAAAS